MVYLFHFSFQNKGFPSPISTKSTLKELLLRIIWTNTVHHAVLNYPVKEYGSHVPSIAYTLRRTPSEWSEKEIRGASATNNDVLTKLLPNYETALVSKRNPFFISSRIPQQREMVSLIGRRGRWSKDCYMVMLHAQCAIVLKLSDCACEMLKWNLCERGPGEVINFYSSHKVKSLLANLDPSAIPQLQKWPMYQGRRDKRCLLIKFSQLKKWRLLPPCQFQRFQISKTLNYLDWILSAGKSNDPEGLSIAALLDETIAKWCSKCAWWYWIFR